MSPPKQPSSSFVNLLGVPTSARAAECMSEATSKESANLLPDDSRQVNQEYDTTLEVLFIPEKNAFPKAETTEIYTGNPDVRVKLEISTSASESEYLSMLEQKDHADHPYAYSLKDATHPDVLIQTATGSNNSKQEMNMNSQVEPHYPTHGTGGCIIIVTTSVNLNSESQAKGGKRFKCAMCPKMCSKVCHLKDHMRTHTGEKTFICHLCRKAFSRKQQLKGHMRIHTGERPFVCHLCRKAFTEKQQLKRHMRIHTGERPFICHICRKAFTEKPNLERHIRIHTGERPFICYLCRQAFTEKQQLKRHMRIHTRAGSWLKFKSSKQPSIVLESHPVVQMVPVSASVSECGSESVVKKSGDPPSAISQRQVNDATHEELITTENIALAGVGSTEMQVLEKDATQAVHIPAVGSSGSKPEVKSFKCEVCPKAWSNMGSLKRHMLGHNGEKPLTCKMCLRRFSDGSHFKRHMRTHTGEKPFVCQLCRKAFTQGS